MAKVHHVGVLEVKFFLIAKSLSYWMQFYNTLPVEALSFSERVKYATYL